MSHKTPSRAQKTTLIVTGAVIALALIAGGVFAYMLVKNSSQPPVFSFSAEKAPGWWGGTNYNSRDNFKEDEYQGDEPIEKLPVAGMTIMHGEGEGKSAADNCFVMYSYRDYPLADIAAAFKKYEDRKVFGDSSITLKTTATVTHTIDTPEGAIHYELRHYDRQSSDPSDTALRGYSHGFAMMKNGYIEVEGVCSTAEQLTGADAVLASVSLGRR